MVEIRLFQPADAARLTVVHNQIYAHEPRTAQSWAYLSHGRAWVLLVDEEVVGYTAVLPVPGLPGLVELEGFIAPHRQREGLATALLHHVQMALQNSDIRQLSYPVTTLKTPAARFLQKNNFFIEHEEWTMLLNLTYHSPLTIHHSPFTIKLLPRQQTISLFQQLYTASFAGTPWDQPFGEAEVAHLLTENDPIYFLIEADRAIGFTWLRQLSATAVALEPIGIIKEKQGMGYGRLFLQTLLNQLAAKGITTVQIGVWANNETAVHLYQRLGFKKTKSLYYLAYDL